MSDNPIERISLRNLASETGAQELAGSPDMHPYAALAAAVMEHCDTTQELEAIRQLPLEKRYVWRVASALKWAFADCDDLNVDADRQTLTPQDFARLTELLRLRPVQFCIFLRALLGMDEMRQMMLEAIAIARRQGIGTFDR